MPATTPPTPAPPVSEAMPPQGRGTELRDGSDHAPLDWAEAEKRINAESWCWLATVRPDGSPHVVPVFAVWSGTEVFVASKDTSRKSRNLAGEPRCVLTTDADGAHLVVEGTARRVTDQATLAAASRAFEEVYGWPTTVDGDLLDAAGGAPTSGGPPYGVQAITPTTAFAFPGDGAFMPTRWRFP